MLLINVKEKLNCNDSTHLIFKVQFGSAGAATMSLTTGCFAKGKIQHYCNNTKALKDTGTTEVLSDGWISGHFWSPAIGAIESLSPPHLHQLHRRAGEVTAVHEEAGITATQDNANVSAS